MAYYSIFPEKDTTIYSHPDRINMNTGRDEILELVEEKSTTGEIYYTSRILMKFANLDIKDVIENKLSGVAKEVTPDNLKISLNLYSTEHKQLANGHVIEALPLYVAFAEGTQRYESNPPYIATGSFQAANGATWVHRTELTSSEWTTSGFATGTTGSYTLQAGGGNWYTGSNFRGEDSFFENDILDTDIDVTSIIQKFSSSYYTGDTYPNAITNNGFIIKKETAVEEDSLSYGGLSFFSTNTHTIYPPKLTFKWDDSTYITGSEATALTSGDIFLSLYNNKTEFQRKSKQRFRLTTRKRYPDRTFVTSSNYLDTQYLPKTSYYSVRDAETDEVIIPFDTNYTKLSADNEGMYFDLYIEGLQPERYYKLMFRVDNNDGINIYDEDYFFKVIR